MAELVFVYGSLKKGHLHHDQLSGALFAGEAQLKEHRLVLYEEAYPALCAAPGSSGTVEGEIYVVTAPQLERLDAFEGVPTLYQRTLVTLGNGQQAWAYVIDSERAARYPALQGPWSGREQRT